uniref:BZIP domain-containing protein n=1 Tax=Oryza meridionalis TaxID=40149 RepID=A0A0E0EF60_9ORYZ
MAEPDLLAPFADLPFPPPFPGDDLPDFPALGDDAFALEDFDLEDLDFDFDVDLFPPDAPPPVTTSSSSAAGSPEAGTSSTGDGGSKNEESADSSSPSRSGSDGGGGGGKDGKDDEAKRRARLVRNRESAHQSRQRKKQYVEELEGKVKVMQATIADLTARISCVTAENAALKQQLGGAAGAGAPPPPMPMYPAVYPLPMPWIHPAYAMRGSQVPLVPIPRLKTQQAASTPEPPAKKARKTKKVAGVSLLGLLFLMMVCGCLVPAINRMYGAAYTGEGAAIVPSHHGRILAVEGPQNSVSNGVDPKVPQNGSETLPALLYLPRNGKHVKINGNLVIKSIVASEKASSRLSNYGGKDSENQGKEETSLAIPGYVAPLEAGEVMDSAKGMRNELMALAPGDGSIYREDDGMLPQWFSEAMSGPMLNSGMCTEVFQFDLSPTTADANGIVPVYSGSVTNTSQNYTENLPSGPVQKVKNRRISYSEAIPLRGSTSNDTDHFKAPPKNHSQSHAGRKPVSSVVVSVLADPREASDRDGEGRISSNSLSRIFVVVLIDSVKYVTYSCVLPFKSHSPHL